MRTYIVASIVALSSVVLLLFVANFSSREDTLLFAIIPIILFSATMMIMGVESDYSFDKRHAAKLISIHDGDSVKLNFHGRVESYRIQYMDTPELGQEDGEAAAAMLGVLLRFKYIEFSIPTKGGSKSYNRNICKIYANGKDVGLEMIKRGYAWIDVRYPVPPEYIHAFADSVKYKRGMFANKNPVHPSLYRNKKKKPKSHSEVDE